VGLENQFAITENRIDDPRKEFTIIEALGKIAQGKLLTELLPESPDQYIARLEKCLAEIKKPEFRISITDEQLDEMIFEKI
jgi:hypothetical protein